VCNGKREKNGSGGLAITELMEPTVMLFYRERWTKNKIDLLELVTLRDSGLPLRVIARQLGYNRATVLRYLSQLKAQGGPHGKSNG